MRVCGLAALLFLASLGWRAYSWTRAPDVQPIFQSGMEALEKNDLAVAYFHMELLHGIRPTPSQAYLLEGAALLKQNNLQEAVRVLSQAAESPDSKTQANLLIGQALYNNRQFQKAISALKASLEADPELTDAYRLLAAAYYDLGATAPAIEALQTVSKLAPKDPRPHRLMGVIYQDMESFEDAAKQYTRFLKLAPNSPDRPIILTELADCLFKAGEYLQLETILPDCPLTPRVLVIAANLKMTAGEQTEALSLVDEALQLEPDHLDALLAKASLLLEKGDIGDAIRQLQAAVDSHPNEYRAHYQLSQALARDGDTELAEKHSTEANRLRELRIHFTELHARASIDVQNADLRLELASVAQELGMEELAINWLSGALAINPNHQQAREALRALRQGDRNHSMRSGTKE